MGAWNVIREELPKFLNEDQAEGFRGVLSALVPQDLTDVGLMVAGGPFGKLAKMGGLALAGAAYSPEAEAGKLQTTGLVMRHILDAASRENLLKLFRDRGSISSPSIALTKAGDFTGSPSLVLNDASKLLDPKTNTANKLYNRDIASFLTSEIQDTPQTVRLGNADLRNTIGGFDAKYFDEDPLLSGEGYAMFGSPTFNSLAAYEKSNKGAKLLPEKRAWSMKVNTPIDRKLQTDIDGWLEANGLGRASQDIKYSEVQGGLAALRQAARQGDKAAVGILQRIQTHPTEYGELKRVGELPLTPYNVKALIMPGDVYSKHRLDPQILRAATKRGIDAGQPLEFMTPGMRGEFEELLGRADSALQRHIRLGNTFANAPGPLKDLVGWRSLREIPKKGSYTHKELEEAVGAGHAYGRMLSKKFTPGM